ncbi:hypothetical protein HY095_01575, partial [Candidatus Micrarchaeota archaeon]|nr:hypothetical protein [Candidatus Micrarchaeota archaeon]
TLRQIKVTGARSTRVTVGSGFDLIAKPVFKRLTFLGPDSTDTDTLTLTAVGRQTYGRITNQTGDGAPSGTNVDVNVTTLKSGYQSAFTAGGKTFDTLYLDKYNGRILVYDSTASQANYTMFSDIADNAVDYQYPATMLGNAVRLYTTASRVAPLALTNTSAPNAVSTGVAFENFTGPTIMMVSYNDTAGGESLPATLLVNYGSGASAGGVVLSWIAVPGATQYLVYGYNGTGTYYLGSTTGTTFNTTATAGITRITATAPNATARAARLRIYEATTDNAPSTLNGNYDINLFPSDANYIFNSSTTGTLTTLYASSVTPGTALAAGYPSTGGTSYEKGFISPGGLALKDLTLTSAIINYPKKLVHARYQFGAPSTVNVTTTGATVTERTMAEGEEFALGGGYKVKVSSITATVSCTGGAAGVAACTPNKAAVVTPLSATDHLVVLDSDAGSTGQLVVVGGPLVNSVAADTPGVADVTNTPGSSVIKVIGSKVVVAGYTAQDTTDAANALVKWLSDNRDAVRGV